MLKSLHRVMMDMAFIKPNDDDISEENMIRRWCLTVSLTGTQQSLLKYVLMTTITTYLKKNWQTPLNNGQVMCCEFTNCTFTTLHIRCCYKQDCLIMFFFNSLWKMWFYNSRRESLMDSQLFRWYITYGSVG